MLAFRRRTRARRHRCVQAHLLETRRRPAEPSQSGDWNIGTVQAGFSFLLQGEHTLSLALDQMELHAAYEINETGYGPNQVIHASKLLYSDGWRTEVVDTSPDLMGDVQVAVSPSDPFDPRVLYTDGYALRHAYPCGIIGF